MIRSTLLAAGLALSSAFAPMPMAAPAATSRAAVSPVMSADNNAAVTRRVALASILAMPAAANAMTVCASARLKQPPRLLLSATAAPPVSGGRALAMPSSAPASLPARPAPRKHGPVASLLCASCGTLPDSAPLCVCRLFLRGASVCRSPA